MKKQIIYFLSLLFIITILAACGTNDENNNTTVSTSNSGQSEVADNAVRITISINNGEQFVNEQEVEIEAGANLLEVLEKTFYVDTNEDNEITSIERVKSNEEENTTWVLIIDDVLSQTLAKDYTLNGGEKITFDLQ